MAQPKEMTISELQAETTRLQSVIGSLETAIADARTTLGHVRAELEKRMRPAVAPRVSDHALLRFIERVMGVDIESFRDRILTDTVRDAIAMGATAVVVEGVRLKIQDNTIVTVLDKREKPKLVANGTERRSSPSIADELEEMAAEKEAEFA
jgi:hypothetical protein